MDPLIILLRIIVPLSIFRFPLIGGLASMWLDAADWNTSFFSATNDHVYYGALDKLLDFYYLTIEAYTVFSWKKSWAKWTALGLYFWRGLGVSLYVLTRIPFLLVIFPNVFEGFFLLIAITRVIQKKEVRFSLRLAVWSATILAIPKIIQEYAQHIAYPNNWHYIRINFFDSLHFVYDNITYQWILALSLVIAVNGFLFWKGGDRHDYSRK